MKFIKFIIVVFIFFSISCSKKDISEIVPGYKVIVNFSKKIREETGLVLYSYGVNNDLPKEYKLKNGIANWSADYALFKTQQDKISLEEARIFLISVVESFLKEINSNQIIIPHLDFYPCTGDLIKMKIYFKDENKIDLGQGISSVFLSKGKLKYDRYEIKEYRSHYPSIGKHFTVHEESYEEALDIVKKQGTLMDL